MGTAEMLKVEVIDYLGNKPEKTVSKRVRYHDDNLPVKNDKNHSKITSHKSSGITEDCEEMDVTPNIGMVNYWFVMALAGFISPALTIILDLRQTVREIPFYKVLNFILKHLYSLVYAWQNPPKSTMRSEMSENYRKAYSRKYVGSAV